jgi:hypothetical protein
VKIIFGKTPLSFEASGLKLEDGECALYDVENGALKHIDLCKLCGHNSKIETWF